VHALRNLSVGCQQWLAPDPEHDTEKQTI